MKKSANDALAISILIGAGILSVWLGIAGPIFTIDPKALNDTAGIAAWAQAIVAGVAIIAVYVAATLPVRAEAKAREDEKRLRSEAIALLLLPEILVLKGEIESCIENGRIYDVPVVAPAMLMSKTDQLYLLGGTGGRLLQAVGMVNGVAAQTRRFQAVATINGVPIQSKMAAGAQIWQNNIEALQLCLMNVDEAIERIQNMGS
jgi:hypothetical protein